jgi:hypothetical protein
MRLGCGGVWDDEGGVSWVVRTPACEDVEAGGVRATSCCASEPAGPGVGFRPSRKAFAISVAFHFAYLIFSNV